MRQLRADAPALVLLALVVLATSALASLLPRQASRTEQAALVAAVGGAPPPVREVRASSTGSPGAFGLALADRAIVDAFPPALAALAGSSTANSTTAALAAVPADGSAPRSPRLELLVRAQGDLGAAATWVEGRAPRGPAGTAATRAGELPVVEVALSSSAAEAVDLAVGDLLVVSPPPTAGRDGAAPRRAVRVTGLFTAADGPAASAAWENAGPVFVPYPQLGDTGDVLAEQVVAVTSPAAVDTLVAVSRLSTTWRYPLDLDRLRVEDVGLVSEAVDDATLAAVPPPPDVVTRTGQSPRIRITSGLPFLLARYEQDAATARSLAAVTLLGLGAIAGATLVVAAVLLSARRGRAVALARSRGFSFGQVLGATGPPVVLLVVLSAVAGLVIGAAAVPGQPWGIPVLLVIVAAVAAVIAVVGATRADYRSGAGPRPRPRSPARRLTAEAGVLIVAVVGVVLLHRRGLAGAGTELGGRADAPGIDPYLSLVPVLLALSVALLALRLSPLPLAMAARAARASRGATTFLGFSSAQRTRSGPVAAAALVVLVVALAFSVFASALSSTVTAGQERASWQRVGADLSVTGSGAAGAVREIAAVSGVDAVVPAFRDDTATLSTGQGQPVPVVLLALEPATYAQARARAGGAAADGVADLGELSRTSTDDGAVPALVAPADGPAAPLGTGSLTLGRGLGQVEVQILATSTAVPAFPGSAPVLLVPAAALDGAAADGPPRIPNQLLVTAASDAAEELATTLDDPPAGSAALDVVLRADVLADLDARPLVRGTTATLTLGVLVAGAYGLVTMTLALVAAAPGRGRLLSVLRTLGLRRRAAGALLAVELLPVAVLAVVSGTAAGVAVLPATAPALDLRPYTGGRSDPALVIEPLHLLALAAAALALMGAAGVVTALLDRRRSLGSALRVGGSS